jgi:ABC-2 type transport system permease protein
MARVWRIARHHFLLEVRKRSFIILLFSLPLFIAFSVGMGILAEKLNAETTILGYVDPAGFLTDTALDNEEVQLIRFETAETAQAALEAGDINAYYLLAADIASSQQAELVGYEIPDWEAQVAFTEMVRRNHLARVPADIAERIVAGSEVVVHPLNSDRSYGENPTITDFLPLVVALIFGFLAVTTSGYMMEALVTEKENRTMEILVTSISAEKLMTGKIIGALGIAGVQLLVYVVCVVVGVIIGRAAGVSWLLELQPRWVDIFQIILISIPVYFFLTAFFTMIGSTLVESTEAQQVSSFIILLLLLPIYFLVAIVEDSTGTLAMAFSIFPPTAILTFALRMLFAAVPWWQVLLSVAISLTSAIVLTWLAAKAFRLGMLRYGQRLKLRELFGRTPVQSRG